MRHRKERLAATRYTAGREALLPLREHLSDVDEQERTQGSADDPQYEAQPDGSNERIDDCDELKDRNEDGEHSGCPHLSEPMWNPNSARLLRASSVTSASAERWKRVEPAVVADACAVSQDLRDLPEP